MHRFMIFGRDQTLVTKLRRSLCLGAALLLAGSGLARAMPVTYNFVNDATDQNGWTLGGSLITDGKLGSLSSSDVTSWTMTISKGVTVYNLSSTDSGAALFFDSLTATATQILTPSMPNGGQVDFVDNGGKTQIDWGYGDFEGLVNGTYLWSAFPAKGYPATGQWDIANAVQAVGTVPEPSTLLLVAIAAVGIIGSSIRRST